MYVYIYSHIYVYIYISVYVYVYIYVQWWQVAPLRTRSWISSLEMLAKLYIYLVYIFTLFVRPLVWCRWFDGTRTWRRGVRGTACLRRAMRHRKPVPSCRTGPWVLCNTLQHTATPQDRGSICPLFFLAPFLTREIQQKPSANVNHIIIDMVHMSFGVCVCVFSCVCVCVCVVPGASGGLLAWSPPRFSLRPSSFGKLWHEQRVMANSSYCL